MIMSNVQFVVDDDGKRTAVMIPVEEWERIQQAKDILEHVYLAGIIEERKGSKPSTSIDSLLAEEGVDRDDLEG